MFEEINERLEGIKEKLHRKNKLEARLKKLKEYQKAEQGRVAHLLQMVQKEEKDVQKLEGLSLTNLFYSFLGRKLEKLDKEKQEALAAKLKYDQAVETLQEIKNECLEIEQEMQDISAAEEQYRALLLEKETLLKGQHTAWSEEFFQLSDQLQDLKAEMKEYHEAIEVGDKALTSIHNAIEALDKAKGWATWDMFGGGMISTAIKHGHIEDARDYIHKAQTRLRHFEQELADIRQISQMKIEMGSFLTFADYFFDGFIVDWVVHGRISDSLEQVKGTRQQLLAILAQLKKQYESLELSRQKGDARRKELLENAE